MTDVQIPPMKPLQGVLIGGPHDGLISPYADGRQHVYMPVPIGVPTYITMAEPALEPEVMPRLVYELLYTDGRPSINDRGQLRYGYAGQR